MNVIEKIESVYEGLSKKRKYIARYLLDNKSNIPFMSLDELSSELNVSEVTILSFCKSIEVASYVELKKEFEILIKEELKVPAKIKSSLEELLSVEDAYKNAIQTQKFNFEKLASNNKLEDYKAGAELIASSRNIYLCGLGSSKIVCEFLQERLRTLGVNALCLNLEDTSLFSHNLIGVNGEDLFILIAFPDYSSGTVKLKDYLKKHQLKYLSITNVSSSPITDGAEVVLLSENRSLVFYNFISSTIILSEVLLIVLSYTKKDQLIPRISRVKEIQEFFLTEE